MKSERLGWLLDCADRLTGNATLPVSVRPILANFEIGLEKQIDVSRPHGGASVRRNNAGNYCVTLLRRSAHAAPLSARERFSLAHEVGHILLDQKFGWAPARGEEYYKCESYCDLFAAHLLVPNRVLAGLPLCGARQAYESLNMLARTCSVSREAAARRLIETHAGLGFLEGVRSSNSVGQPVVELKWGTSSINDCRLNRSLHLTEREKLGKLLLSCCAGANRFDLAERLVAGLGLVFGRIAGQNCSIAVVHSS